MRIIAGLAKGRNLLSPIGATRPTSDRAREALFSTLESEFGEFTDIHFLDLYCGSGAVAAEALSRGVAVVHAVDNDEKAVKIARENLALFEKITGSGASQVFSSSAQRFLDRKSSVEYDIVFIDPPYELDNSSVEKILSSLRAHIKTSTIIAVERDAKSPPFQWPTKYQSTKERTYGHAVIYYGTPAQNG
jgi:16S rRNA (guanine966-N2)-methyltransferase